MTHGTSMLTRNVTVVDVVVAFFMLVALYFILTAKAVML